MNSRKRPADPHSRGHSPPEKRYRAPDRSSRLPDRPRNDRDATDKRPQNGLLRAEGNLAAQRTASAEQSPLHIMSPNNIGSPAHVAPPAPSMLPAIAGASVSGGGLMSSSSHTNHLQQHEGAIDRAPISVASLRNMRDKKRRQAIETEAKAPSTTTSNLDLETQLKSVQTELKQSNKEREKEHREMLRKIKRLESLSPQTSSLQDEVGHQQKSLSSNHASQEDVLARLNRLEDLKPSFEKLPAEIAGLDKKFEQLKALSDIVESLKDDIAKHAQRLDQASAKSEAIDSTLGKLPGLRSDIESIKNSRKSQPSPPTGEDINKVMRQTVQSELDKPEGVTKRAMKRMEEKLNKQVMEASNQTKRDHDTLEEKLSSELATLSDSGQKTDTSISTLVERIHETESNETKNYSRLSTLQKDFEKFRGDTVKDVDQLFDETRDFVQKDKNGKTFLEKLNQIESKQEGNSSKLKHVTNEQESLSKEQLKLVARLVVVEKTLKGNNTVLSDFETVATTMSRLSDASEKAATRTEKLENDIGEVQKVAKSVKDLPERIKVFEDRASSLYQLPTQISDIQTQVTALANLETRLASIEARKPVMLDQGGTQSGQVQVETGATQKTMDEQNVRLELLQDNFAAIDSVLYKTEEVIHNHGVAIETLQTGIPELFAEYFDPLKRDYEQRFTTHSEQLEVCQDEVSKLKLAVARVDPTEVMSVIEDTKNLTQEVSDLRVSLHNEIAQRGQDIQDVNGQLATKEDTLAVVRQFDSVRQGLNNLESRYQNISTDELHQQMVHWFVQMYPSNAVILQQFSVVQQDVARLMTFTPQMNWIKSHEKDLFALATMVSQLQTLVQPSNTPHQLPDNQTKIDKVSTDVKTAMTTSEDNKSKMNQLTEHVNKIGSALTTLQTQVNSLDLENSPFARTQEVHALETTVQKLQEDVTTGFTDAHDARVELRTAAGTANDQRVKAEAKIKSSVEELRTSLSNRVEAVEELRTSLSNRVEAVEIDGTKLRREFDDLMNDCIEPNKELFADNFPLVVITRISEVQRAVEYVNQQLPSGSLLPIKWSRPVADNDDDKGNGKGKGKAKVKP
ncbi:hypothetical protein P153DRAFT_397108 [Dothidotthia symphoricarpi CBS 119687]|uniref:Uncharacterized protein n=1 Tax=Dothidotthia symphoricarpi CBS 119687 TaxID=1392245 RepID=A0A6A6ADD6_9PLEO|nr:uncharacterized protein P153DRAFT_397108 [Dothidotthia symphoricarpi CBS 119687]KAF2128887.1 hypothetical protein P153DRAFT_397108 [Dothidotthia symphoricarpi CBS 119687]